MWIWLRMCGEGVEFRMVTGLILYISNDPIFFFCVRMLLNSNPFLFDCCLDLHMGHEFWKDLEFDFLHLADKSHFILYHIYINFLGIITNTPFQLGLVKLTRMLEPHKHHRHWSLKPNALYAWLFLRGIQYLHLHRQWKICYCPCLKSFISHEFWILILLE